MIKLLRCAGIPQLTITPFCVRDSLSRSCNMSDFIVISLQSWRKATQVIEELLNKLPVYGLFLDIRGIDVMEQKKWIKNTSGVWRFLGRKKMVLEVIAGRS